MKNPHNTPKAVIFDMDGTITRPIIDFARIKREIGAEDTPILEFLEAIEDEEKYRKARAIVDGHEREAATASTLNPGVRELLEFLRSKGIPTAILTRNTRESVDTVTAKHDLHFDCVVAADDHLPPKPDPEPIRYIARQLDVEATEVMMVGDFLFDVQCGKAAGAATVLLRSDRFSSTDTGADHVITKMTELIDLIDNHFAGDEGVRP